MRHWSTFAAALRYYLLEGFLYVESKCWCCHLVQRTLVFPGSETIECLGCGRMTSKIETVIEAHGN